MYRLYRQEVVSCSHVQSHILFLITGSTILIDFLLLRSYRSSSFERNVLRRLISCLFKNLRLNFLQRKGVSYEWAGTVARESMDQPGKVANPARGQLTTENEYFPVPVRA